jgi:hypothetical protein
MQRILHDAGLPFYFVYDQIIDHFSSESRCDYAQIGPAVEHRILLATKPRHRLHRREPFGMNMPTLEPGQFVRHPDRPDWGLGQVQSAIGDRITVNFENAGKILVNAAVVRLEPVDDPSD